MNDAEETTAASAATFGVDEVLKGNCNVESFPPFWIPVVYALFCAFVYELIKF